MADAKPASKNLSEILFKPKTEQAETSTIIGRPFVPNSANAARRWYRFNHQLQWVWRGADPREINEVLARIAASTAPRSNEALIDTVVGYRKGNWIYEWSQQGMHWQKKAQQETDAKLAGRYWLQAANFYSIASYPHLKGDELAEQAAIQCNRAYGEAAAVSDYSLKKINFTLQDGHRLTGFLHLPGEAKTAYPTVLMCGDIDALQTDYYRLFEDYLAPQGIAMLTLDLPSSGYAARWKLTPDTSYLHLQVLNALSTIPWVDHQRVSVFGFRFGANIAVRLAYLAPRKLRAVACIAPIVHQCLATTEPELPEMYLDVLANRMGITPQVLETELCRYSLKTQGLLGRGCATPILAAGWAGDIFSSKDELSLMTALSAGGQLISLAPAPLYRGLNDSLEKIVAWLINKMS